MAIDSLRHAELDPCVAPGFEGRQRRPPSTGSRGSRDSPGSASDLTWRSMGQTIKGYPLVMTNIPPGKLT